MDYTLTADYGTWTATGQAASLLASRRLDAERGALRATGKRAGPWFAQTLSGFIQEMRATMRVLRIPQDVAATACNAVVAIATTSTTAGVTTDIATTALDEVVSIATEATDTP